MLQVQESRTEVVASEPDLQTLKGEWEVFSKWGEEGTAYVKSPSEGMFGRKGGLIWLEECDIGQVTGN